MASHSKSGSRMKQGSATLTRIWAKRGTLPRDQRYNWAYLFAAACPSGAASAATVVPEANAGMMNLHLDAISKAIAPGAHAAVLLDGAGHHRSRHFRVPGISPSSRCRAMHRNSIVPKPSGSICAKTSSQTLSSTATATSSIKLAKPGSSSSTTKHPSQQLQHETGQRSLDQAAGIRQKQKYLNFAMWLTVCGGI